MRFWIELRTLLHRPKTQTKNTTIVYSRRVDWRTAISTERQHTFVAAVGSLYIRLRLPAKFEVLCLYRNRDSVWCAGNGLTVSAVANDDVIGIYVRLIANPFAMTTAINFHSSHPNIPFWHCVDSASSGSESTLAPSTPRKKPPPRGSWHAIVSVQTGVLEGAGTNFVARRNAFTIELVL